MSLPTPRLAVVVCVRSLFQEGVAVAAQILWVWKMGLAGF